LSAENPFESLSADNDDRAALLAAGRVSAVDAEGQNGYAEIGRGGSGPIGDIVQRAGGRNPLSDRGAGNRTGPVFATTRFDPHAVARSRECRGFDDRMDLAGCVATGAPNC
jgi:hypothetical protein